jgi:hypothetical protein
MNHSKAIIGTILSVKDVDYNNQQSDEISLVVEDIFNQLELKCKVDVKDDYLSKYREVLELRSLIRNLTSDLYLSRLMSNHNKEQAIKSLNQI